MDRTSLLKKIRKCARKSREQSFNLFWDTVAEMTFKQRARLIWKIMKHPYIRPELANR